MEERYYLAIKECSRGLWERLMLEVDERGNVKVHRGETRERFKVGEDGRPVCTTDNSISLPYNIIGPLTDEQFNLECRSDAGWSELPRRVHSARRFGRYS